MKYLILQSNIKDKMNGRVFFKSNSKFVFVFIENVKLNRCFKYCFSVSSFFFFFKKFDFFFTAFPFFIKQDISCILTYYIQSFCASTFFFKTRLRFSGLGYGLNLDTNSNSFLLNVGLTNPPKLKLPTFIFLLKTNKKKKKVLLKSLLSYLLYSFASTIRQYRRCDVYKHKGIRWRFEKVRYKQGKRSGRR